MTWTRANLGRKRDFTTPGVLESMVSACSLRLSPNARMASDLDLVPHGSAGTGRVNVNRFSDFRSDRRRYPRLLSQALNPLYSDVSPVAILINDVVSRS